MEIYGGSSRRKHTTAADIARVRSSGQRADQIAQMRRSHHQSIELPQAEEFLKNSLNAVDQEEKNDHTNTHLPIKKENFFIKILQYITSFFRSIFIPNK